MATPLLEVISDSQTIQLSQGYRNLCLIAKTLTPVNRLASNYTTTIHTPIKTDSLFAYSFDSYLENLDPTYPHAGPLYDVEQLVKQPYLEISGKGDIGSLPERVGNMSMSVMNYVASYTGNGLFYYTHMLPPAGSEWSSGIYEFNFPDPPTTPSRVGLQILDESENIVFDMIHKPLKVVGFFQAPATYYNTSPWKWGKGLIYNFPPEVDGVKKRYAIAPLENPIRFSNSFNSGDVVTSSGITYRDMYVIQRNRLIIFPQSLPSSLGNGGILTGMKNISFLLIDVTGY